MTGFSLGPRLLVSLVPGSQPRVLLWAQARSRLGWVLHKRPTYSAPQGSRGSWDLGPHSKNRGTAIDDERGEAPSQAVLLPLCGLGRAGPLPQVMQGGHSRTDKPPLRTMSPSPTQRSLGEAQSLSPCRGGQCRGRGKARHRALGRVAPWPGFAGCRSAGRTARGETPARRPREPVVL